MGVRKFALVDGTNQVKEEVNLGQPPALTNHNA